MRLACNHRRPLALMLFVCILFSALHCASGLGQMVGMQLAGADQHEHHHAQPAEAAEAHAHSEAHGGCEFASPFSAIILAAFFGLFARLALAVAPALPRETVPRQPRLRWPQVNPRASPASLPVL